MSGECEQSVYNNERTNMKPLVIYHANCTDGYGAAYAAWVKFGTDAEYVPMHYNKELTVSVEGRDVYIVDFSFPKAFLWGMAEKADSVVMLDHHKTAFEDLGWESHPMVEYKDDEKGLHIVLNKNKSGAMLAWDYFVPHIPAPRVIRRIDDRDRWQFEYEDSKAIHAALQYEKPWSFEKWDKLTMESEFESLVTLGNVCLKLFDVQINDAIRQAVPCLIYKDGRYWAGRAVNAAVHQSEVGHRLAHGCGTFALMWWVDKEGKVICSLRSVDELDVSVLAKAFGGGGHKNSCGFTTDMKTLSTFITISGL